MKEPIIIMNKYEDRLFQWIIESTNRRLVGRVRVGSVVSSWHKFTLVGKTPLKVKCHCSRRECRLYCQRLSSFTCVIIKINKWSYIYPELSQNSTDPHYDPSSILLNFPLTYELSDVLRYYRCERRILP